MENEFESRSFGEPNLFTTEFKSPVVNGSAIRVLAAARRVFLNIAMRLR